MAEPKYYTAKQIEEAFGTPVATVIEMWKNKRFPNSKIDENKTILIPEDDLKATKIIKETTTPPKQQEPIQDFSKLKQEAEEYVKTIKVEADKYAEDVKAKVDAEVKSIMDNAEKIKEDMLQKIDDACASRLAEADNEAKQKEAVTAELDAKIAKQKAELEQLQGKVSLCLKKYNEIRKAVVDNRSYHYNLMMRDTWGRLLVWMGKLFKG